MEESIVPNKTIPTEKLYKDRQVWAGSILGGPLAAGYCIAKNFKELGEEKKRIITLIITVPVTIIVFTLAFILPDGFPNSVLPILYTGAAILIVKIYQGERLAEHLQNGGLFQSWWKTVLVSVLGLVLTLAPILALIYFTFPTELSKKYGKTENEIIYREGNISESELDLINSALRETGFFADEFKSYMYVVKTGSSYELFVSFDGVGEIDAEAVQNFREFRNEIQGLFREKKIIVNLTYGDVENVVTRIE